MRLLVITIFLLGALVINVKGQILKPVQWSYTAKKIADNTFEVHLTANINPGWHIYSQYTPKGGPVPTTFTFKKDPAILSLGKPQEAGKLQQMFQKEFDMNVKYFSDKVDFVQVVKVKSTTPPNFSGTIEYMVCNDKQCLPPIEVDFFLTLK